MPSILEDPRNEQASQTILMSELWVRLRILASASKVGLMEEDISCVPYVYICTHTARTHTHILTCTGSPHIPHINTHSNVTA